ncbi:glycosyltransferase family 2 protein [Thermophilibacter sp.]
MRGPGERAPRVLVIIPAYNERENILTTVSKVVDAGYDYVVVNDGSKDDTLELCRANGVNVLDLPQNLGIGGAVQAGHKYARRYSYDIDVQFDGDGQHDARYLGDLVQKVREGANIAVGSRFVGETGGFKSTFMRRVGIRWLSWCLRLFAGVRVADPTSGFRACDRRAIELFCESYPIDYPEPESIATAARHGLEVREVPVVMHERQGGVSSINALKSVYYMVKVTLAIVIASHSAGKR